MTAHLRDVQGTTAHPFLMVRTSSGRRYTLNPAVGGRVKQYRVFDGGRRLSDTRICRGGSFASDDLRDTMRFRVPASCIGAPASARFRFHMQRATFSDVENRGYFDDVAVVGKAKGTRFTEPLSRG